MKKTLNRSILLPLALAFLGFACRVVQPLRANNQAECEAKGGTWSYLVDKNGKSVGYCEETVYQEGHQCSAASDVSVSGQILKDGYTEFGTRVCEFKLTFTKITPKVIWLMGYVHEQDVWQDLDKSEWDVIQKMDESAPEPTFFDDDPNDYTFREWFGYYNYSHDPDDIGPTMLVVEKYAVILDTTDCASLRSDVAYLELVAVAVPPTCKPEGQ